MAWVESVSPSFRARHASGDADDADRVLHLLERTRDELDHVFPKTVADVEVVMHGSWPSLALSNPLVPVTAAATSPSARRYVAGWCSGRELHVLTPKALRARASTVKGSSQMLELTPSVLYTRRVIAENNRELSGARAPQRMLLGFRWAWLLEGAARWFSGQTDHARPAIARRLHEGDRPSFPPGIRDAALLGGTVIDLLVREEGEAAAVQLACRLHPDGAASALSRAFGGRALVHTEGAWRSHLARLAGSQ
jgi:hypothetical protein